MRLALSLAVLVALTTPARAGGGVGVIVTGDGSIQPQLVAQIESWLVQHGHVPEASPMPPEAVTSLIDCFVTEDQPCARGVVERSARPAAIVYARVDTRSTASGTRDVVLTGYWFQKGRAAVSERRTCEHCTDASLRATADELMKQLVRASPIGHVKLKSTPPGARIQIDGQPIGVTPLDWDLPAGPHTVQLDRRGYATARRDIVVVEAKVDTVAIELTPLEAPDQRAAGTRWLPIGGLAVAGLAIAAGGALIAIHEDKGPSAPPRVHNTRAAGLGLTLGGAALAGVSAYFLWFRSSPSSSSSSPSSAPAVAFTGDAGYVGWQGQF